MNELSLRVDGAPEAPVLLFANSLGTSSDVWEPQVRALSSRFRCVRYELRGHGTTQAPPGPYTIADLGGDAVAVLDELEVERASVLGLSLGGTVGLWLAIHHPSRVDRLVVASSRASWGPQQSWHERMARVRASSPSALSDLLLERWFTPAYAAATPQLRDWVASMLDSTSTEGYVGCCQALADVDLTAELRDIAAPTLILAGSEDPAVALSDAAGLTAAIHHASLQVMAPGAHLLNIEQAERFNEAILDHLAGPQLRRGQAVREAVLGSDHVSRTDYPPGSLSADFYNLITRYAWGEIWSRPGLDLRSRSCITLAILVALGRFDELGFHLLAARRNGLSDGEIEEVLLHATVYCGVPAGNAAFAAARGVLEVDSGS